MSSPADVCSGVVDLRSWSYSSSLDEPTRLMPAVEGSASIPVSPTDATVDDCPLRLCGLGGGGRCCCSDWSLDKESVRNELSNFLRGPVVVVVVVVVVVRLAWLTSAAEVTASGEPTP